MHSAGEMSWWVKAFPTHPGNLSLMHVKVEAWFPSDLRMYPLTGTHHHKVIISKHLKENTLLKMN